MHKVNPKNNMITNSKPLPPKPSRLGGQQSKPDLIFKSPMKPQIGMIHGGQGTPGPL